MRQTRNSLHSSQSFCCIWNRTAGKKRTVTKQPWFGKLSSADVDKPQTNCEPSIWTRFIVWCSSCPTPSVGLMLTAKGSAAIAAVVLTAARLASMAGGATLSVLGGVANGSPCFQMISAATALCVCSIDASSKHGHKAGATTLHRTTLVSLHGSCYNLASTSVFLVDIPSL